MITIGQAYTLKVLQIVEFGAYLDAENLGQILLPRRHAPKDVKVGDALRVFLYLDTEDRPSASMVMPKAAVGEFAYLPVAATTRIGAFLDWGLDKDLFVPFAEQHRPMEMGHSYIVFIYIDKLDGRIVASSKLDKFLDDERPHDFKPQQQVNLLIGNSTDLGYKAIVNNSHWGVLYKSEVFQRLSFGQSKKGFIKHVRPDGRIDLSLQGGQETRDKYSKIVLQYLEKHNGFAPLHDKSEPELISELFGMSKKAFKKTIGGLYKQKVIRIEDNGIYLIKPEA
jgi:hypothetical protein